MQPRLAGAHVWFLGMLWLRLCLFHSGGNYLWSCSFVSTLCRSYCCAISMPDEIGCQVTPASGSMLCDAFLQRLACCISFGTNRVYGTLLVQYITILLYFSKVHSFVFQQSTVHYSALTFFYGILRFWFFLKVIYLKLHFAEIEF